MYGTTPHSSTGETHFSMTYGVEAVIPLETGFPTSRTSSFNPRDNDEQLTKSLDLIEEKRKNAMVQLAYYQQKLKQGYDANVKLRPLTPGDLVLRKVVGAAKNPAWGKLGPNWEGPYCITSKAGIEVYFLEDLGERVIPRPWNVNKKYLLVGIDYFMKWVEAEPLANIRDVVAKDSFGRTLSLDLEFLMCSSRTRAFRSIAKYLEDIVMSWGLQIGILLLLIPKEMDKRKLYIKL